MVETLAWTGLRRGSCELVDGPRPAGRGRAEEELEWWGRITRQPFTLVTVMFRYEWPGWTCCSEEWLVL